MRSDEFLKWYKVLEGELERKYAGRKRTVNSVVMQYLADRESTPVKEKLDLCREVRNILSHNADEGGDAVVEPSQSLLDDLQEIITYVKRPPLAIHFMTPRDQMLTADLGQRVYEVMRAMERRGFSHIPVIGKSGLTGVFSVGTVFSYCMHDMGEVGIGHNARIRDFLRWLPLDSHEMECYGYVDEGATYADVKWEFERIKRNEKRLAVLFMTKTGKVDEPLMGMITPWDVLGERG